METPTRHFINLSYLGTRFHGWQIQPGDISVQQRMEEALSTVLRTPVAVVGAGRTDAGVNASMMMAHADLPLRVDDVKSSTSSNCAAATFMRSKSSAGGAAHDKPDAKGVRPRWT